MCIYGCNCPARSKLGFFVFPPFFGCIAHFTWDFPDLNLELIYDQDGSCRFTTRAKYYRPALQTEFGFYNTFFIFIESQNSLSKGTVYCE